MVKERVIYSPEVRVIYSPEVRGIQMFEMFHRKETRKFWFTWCINWNLAKYNNNSVTNCLLCAEHWSALQRLSDVILMITTGVGAIIISILWVIPCKATEKFRTLPQVT